MKEMDYTKYKLKPAGDIAAGIKNCGSSYCVVACNKCFTEYVKDTEPEPETLTAELKTAGLANPNILRVDFLCNKNFNEKIISGFISDNKSSSIVVISCGIGVQSVGSYSAIPVISGCDSMSYYGHHGIALSYNRCDACGQCYLNDTAGICPVTACAKSLVNGPCGGAKDGKCEVNKNKDCGWVLIYRKLEKQGRLKTSVTHPAKIRDYNINTYTKTAGYTKTMRDRRFTGFYGGFYPIEHKELSEDKSITVIPAGDIVAVPLAQHIGAPCTAVVKPGDNVTVGQLIGKIPETAKTGCPVHSPVSGTVKSIEYRINALGVEVLTVMINNDGKNTISPSIKPGGDTDKLTKQELLEIIKNAGISGMGGAGFPAWLKLNPVKPVDTVILNGCECEPYLTTDYRLMIEHAERILYGLKAMQKTTGAVNGIIAVEDNKPAAFNAFTAVLTKEKEQVKYPNITVVGVKTKYPQGAERMLITRLLNRVVPRGGFPYDVGVVVQNVATAKAVADAVLEGIPLTNRVVTITGEYIKNPGNYEVAIGTSIQYLLNHCGLTAPLTDTVLKLGGPMMGIDVDFTKDNFDLPITKTTSGITVTNKKVVEKLSCIKCGRCVDVCPMELSPSRYVYYGTKQDWKSMGDTGVMDCIECGCCENICSSKSSLVAIIKQAKKELRKK
ncbi:MAG: electron transport complex subunit RsxC [Elusimicrobiota bacterium]